jgi:hypothetical protein
MSEDIYADREGAGWSLDFKDAPLQIFRQLPLRSFWVYMRVVELYTARSLTKQGDILAAFSGVSNWMRQKMRAPFVFGLPTSHLDLALLWEHLKPVERRENPSSTKSDSDYGFPSWSWTGWAGAVAQYRRDLSVGCLENVKEWLELRTWIRWYVRDDNGGLRPLWHDVKWLLDVSEHEIWQGYGHERSSGAKRFWSKGDTSQDLRAALTKPLRGDFGKSPVGSSEESDDSTEWSVDSTDLVVHEIDQRHQTRHPSHVRTRQQTQSRQKVRTVHPHRTATPSTSAAFHNPLRQQPRNLPAPIPKPEPKPALQDRAVQSEPLQIKSPSLLQRLQALLIWLRDNYRREIVAYMIDICLFTLRLITFLLGVPMIFTRSETSQYPRLPSQQQGINMGQQLRPPPPPAGQGQRAGNAPPRPPHGAVNPRNNGGLEPPPPPPPPGSSNHGHPPARVMPGSMPIGASPHPSGYVVDRPPHGHKANGLRDSSPSSSTMSRRRRVHDMVFEEDDAVEPEHTESKPTFRITLKEFPYQPVIAPFHPSLGGSKVNLMPILQFWTWHSFLHIHSPPPDESGLTRCNVADKFGDWCGSIVLDNRWVENTKTAKHEFIAISEAKKFTDAECGTWSYYVPKEREESEWDLFFVLLIAWSDGRWERVGLGKVFKEAFRDATWKEIVLA